LKGIVEENIGDNNEKQLQQSDNNLSFKLIRYEENKKQFFHLISIANKQILEDYKDGILYPGFAIFNCKNYLNILFADYL
jgi:hypothetical protein